MTGPNDRFCSYALAGRCSRYGRPSRRTGRCRREALLWATGTPDDDRSKPSRGETPTTERDGNRSAFGCRARAVCGEIRAQRAPPDGAGYGASLPHAACPVSLTIVNDGPDCWAVVVIGAWDSLRRMNSSENAPRRHGMAKRLPVRLGALRASLDRARRALRQHRHHPALGLADRDRPGCRDRRHRDRDLRARPADLRAGPNFWFDDLEVLLAATRRLFAGESGISRASWTARIRGIRRRAVPAGHALGSSRRGWSCRPGRSSLSRSGS